MFSEFPINDMMWKFAMNQNQNLWQQIPCWNLRAHTEQSSGADLERGQNIFKSHDASEEIYKQFLDSFNQCSQILPRRFGSAYEVWLFPFPYRSLTTDLRSLLMGLELLCPGLNSIGFRSCFRFSVGSSWGPVQASWYCVLWKIFLWFSSVTDNFLPLALPRMAPIINA